MAQTRGQRILEMLDKPVKNICYTQEQFEAVYNLLSAGEDETCSGSMADAVVKTLAKKYYPYCSKSMSLPVMLNILYAIVTENSCSVSYTIAAAYKQAKIKQEETGGRLPIEFFLSETLECVDTAPKSFGVFADDDESTTYTLRTALEGMAKQSLIFPSDTNRVVPYEGKQYYLAYVENKTRWLAVLGSDVAAHVTMYSNPIEYTPKGLVQGETLLRLLGNRRGIVIDDFVIE